MMTNPLATILAQQSPNPATAGGDLTSFLLMMVATVFIFYWFLIRPQNLKQKETEAMLRSVRPGDKIVTHSGIIGIVMRVRDSEVVLKVDEKTNARLTVMRTAIMTIADRPSGEHKGDDDDKAGGVSGGKAIEALLAGRNPLADKPNEGKK